MIDAEAFLLLTDEAVFHLIPEIGRCAVIE